MMQHSYHERHACQSNMITDIRSAAILLALGLPFLMKLICVGCCKVHHPCNASLCKSLQRVLQACYVSFVSQQTMQVFVRVENLLESRLGQAQD